MTTKLTYRQSTAQVLEQLPDGTLERLLQHGIIPSSILKYRDIYYYYDSLIRVSKTTPSKAAFITANKFDVSVMTVYRAVKVMK